MQKPLELRRGTADLHVHTTASDGSDSPHAVYQTAARRGLDVIAVTDHDTLLGGLIAADVARRAEAPPCVIVGEEVSSSQGHIIGLFLRELVRPGMNAADTIRAIHAQGGVATMCINAKLPSTRRRALSATLAFTVANIAVPASTSRNAPSHR